MLKKVIITGASGMVGGIILAHCLESKEIGEVRLFVRKPTGKTHPKIREVVVSDFKDYTGMEDAFKDVTAAYFCIGVYTGAVPDAQFREITVDYTKAFADSLKQQSPGAVVCFLSGAGADPKEKSKTSFARYKGMAENYLIGKDFGGLFIFRPAYIYPVEKRKEPNFSYRLFRALYPVLGALGESLSIKSTELGAAMYHAGLQAPEKTILENKDIIAYFRSIKASS
jgi:uncharacterized protein YbjT (DUF2867 family)